MHEKCWAQHDLPIKNYELHSSVSTTTIIITIIVIIATTTTTTLKNINP